LPPSFSRSLQGVNRIGQTGAENFREIQFQTGIPPDSLLDHPCPVRDGREYALLPRAGGKEKINLLKLQLLKR